jgi:hypothetical protein
MLSGKSNHRVADAWRAIVGTYSDLSLTFPKDMLPALSGLAQMCMQMRPGDRYLAGLWYETLIEDLAWNSCYNLPTRPRPEGFRAPSWSWASITQTVMFSYANERLDRGIHARVVRASTILAGSDPTGEVESGSIVLLALVEPATIAEVMYDRFNVRSSNADTGVLCYADTTTELEDGTISQGNSVLCLCLKSEKKGPAKYVLVLVAVEDRPGVYRRIGMTEIFTKNFTDSCFKQEMEVEII